MIRGLVATAVALLALHVGALGSAQAASQPSLATSEYRVGVLQQKVADARDTIVARRRAVNILSRQLERAADRYAADRGRTAGALLDALSEIRRRAHTSRVLPRLISSERRLAVARTQLASARAVVRSLRESTPAPAVAVTRGAWAADFLRTIGAPLCRDNMVSLVAWQTAESTTAAFNPLATTLGGGLTTQFNSVGVRNYATYLDGVQATVRTLQLGYASYGYGWILYRLGRCDAPEVTAAAINASGWCYGCAGGAADRHDAFLDDEHHRGRGPGAPQPMGLSDREAWSGAAGDTASCVHRRR